MSSGQIRSYISFLSVDSDDDYINRITNMINNIEDEKEKKNLQVEFLNKLNQVNIIKKYTTQKNNIQEINQEAVDINTEADSILEEEPALVDDIEYQPVIIKNDIYEKYPSIYATPEVLIYISNAKISLNRKKEIESTNPKIKLHKIPSNPIYEKTVSNN